MASDGHQGGAPPHRALPDGTNAAQTQTGLLGLCFLRSCGQGWPLLATGLYCPRKGHRRSPDPTASCSLIPCPDSDAQLCPFKAQGAESVPDGERRPLKGPAIQLAPHGDPQGISASDGLLSGRFHEPRGPGFPVESVQGPLLPAAQPAGPRSLVYSPELSEPAPGDHGQSGQCPSSQRPVTLSSPR